MAIYPITAIHDLCWHEGKEFEVNFIGIAGGLKHRQSENLSIEKH